jgi:hypothetical protein
MTGIGNAVVGGFSSANAANSLPNGQQLPGGGGFVPPGPASNAYQLQIDPFVPFAP